MGLIDTDFQIMISSEDEGKGEEFKTRGFRSACNIFLLRKEF